MIDPEARIELLRSAGTGPPVAVILLDVVIGPRLARGPGRQLAPACAAMAAAGAQVVAYVLGTDQDPQGFAGQRET